MFVLWNDFWGKDENAQEREPKAHNEGEACQEDGQSIMYADLLTGRAGASKVGRKRDSGQK